MLPANRFRRHVRRVKPGRLAGLLAGLLLAGPVAATTIVSFAPPGPPIVSGLDPSRPPIVQAADLNLDGRPDLVLRTDIRGRAFVVMNLGGDRFGPLREAAPYEDVLDAATGDFNGDGIPDIVLVRGDFGVTSRTISILLGDGTGGFREAAGSATIVANQASSPAAADLDGDGHTDLVLVGADWTGVYRIFVAIFAGDGSGGLGPPRIVPITAGSGGIEQVLATDLDRDGRPDLLVTKTYYRGGEVVALLNRGGGSFGPETSVAPGNAALVADFNRDSVPDLFSVGSNACIECAFFVSLGDGDGGFRQTFADTVGSYGYTGGFLAAVDLDGDGLLDVVAGGGTSGGFLAYLGHGDGTFERADAVPAPLLLADFDGDGKADVLTAFGGDLYIRRNNTGEGAFATDLVVPAYVSTPGSLGAFFATELTAANVGSTTARLDLVFTDADTGGEFSWSTSVPAHGQLTSIPPPAGLLPPRYRGTLVVRVSGASAPDAVSILATTRTPSANGRAGTAYPAVPRSGSFDGTAWIGWLAETDQDRTNLAVLNAGTAGDGNVTLRITVYSAGGGDPRRAVLPDVTLSPGRVRQFDRVLRASGLAAERGFARVERIAGDARFFAYAVVNDNATSDGSYQAAVPEGRRSGETRLVVPVVVETHDFESELVVTNTAATSKGLHLEYVAKNVATPDRTVALDLTVPGQGQIRWERFVEALRQSGFASVLPRGSSYAGALFVSVADGDVEGLLAGARTVTADDAGRYGLYAPALPLSGAADATAWLTGLRTDAETRSNVALVNTGAPEDGDAVFRIEVFLDSRPLPSATLDDVRVPARSWLQLNSLLAPLAPYGATGAVRITKTAGRRPFVAYGVNNDGATPGERTGDGSYLPMQVLEGR